MESQMLTQTNLLDRGWTKKTIEVLLGEPDQTKPNPHYSKGSPMKLWESERVEKAETDEVFQQAAAKKAERSDRGKAVAETKKKTTLKNVQETNIKVKQMPLAELYEKAVKNRNNLNRTREWEGWDDDATVEGADQDTLNRWAVNYLRHSLTPYHSVLNNLTKKIGRRDAVLLLQERIFQAIAKTYPELKDECDRQYLDKVMYYEEYDYYNK